LLLRHNAGTPAVAPAVKGRDAAPADFARSQRAPQGRRDKTGSAARILI